MRRSGVILATVLGILCTVTSAAGEEQIPFKDRQDRVSYAIDVTVGKDLKRQAVEK